MVPVRSRRLSSSPGLARHDLRRLRHRDLHFGDRGDRDFRGQHVVQHMVVAQIGVRQDIVADPLRRAQTAAMPDHQPRLGPDDREVIGDRLRIRRPDADIDQRDPRPVRRHQMVGGHLVASPGAVVDQLVGIVARPDHDVARAGQCGKAAAVTQLPCRPPNEFIDIAVIVGEQYEALRVLRRGPHVMPQPREREVGTQCIEQRERPRGIGRTPQTVGDLVADMRQFGRGEMPRQFAGGDRIQAERVGRCPRT